MSGCNGICLLLLVDSMSILCLLSLISFAQTAWPCEVAEKYFFQGLSSTRKIILLLNYLCTPEITYAVPVHS